MEYKVFGGDGAHVGGNANNGTNAGLAYVNSNNAPSDAHTNIGSRLNWGKYLLSEPTPLPHERPCLLAKNHASCRYYSLCW